MNHQERHDHPRSMLNTAPKPRRVTDWIYFGFFFLVLTLLSLFSLPAWFQYGLVLVGLLLPVGLMILRTKADGLPEYLPCLQETFPPIGEWTIVLLAAAALLLRFGGLTNLLVWPQADEGFTGIAGIELSRQWDWRFFYSDGQSPPVLDWVCGFFFKCSDAYFLNLWFPPAVFSVLTLVLSLLAARQFFSRSFSWLLAGLIAFSFWPLYLGRLGLQVVMFPPWEMAVFWALGKFLKTSRSSRLKWACILGFVVGLGAYTYVPWVFIPVVVSLVLLGEKGFPRKENYKIFFVYLISLVLGASWFLVSCLREGYGDHISALWAGKTGFSWYRHVEVIFDYFNVVFWGFAGEVPRYIPFQGGYLNPLLGALFFIGLAEAWRLRKLAFVRVLAAAFFLFLLPGFLSMNVQGLRIVPLMPLVLLLTAFGFQGLTRAWAPSRRWWLALVLFFFSGTLDSYRIVQPYLDASRYDETFRRIDKNPALYRAYQLLQSSSRETGLVFTDFTPERDQTLRGATYPFNAAWNSSLRPAQSPWAAVLVEMEEVPQLSLRFPGAVWNRLGKGSSGAGDLILGVIPVTEDNHKALMGWAGAPFQYFQGLSSAVNEVKNQKTYDGTQDRFNHPPEEVTRDPFLKACWERKRLGFYDYFGRH